MPSISGLEAPSSSGGGSLAGCTGAGASDQVRLEVVRGIKVVRRNVSKSIIGNIDTAI